MSADLFVFRPGTMVTVAGAEATVAEVSIGTNGRVQYRIIWWKDGTRHDVWL